MRQTCRLQNFGGILKRGEAVFFIDNPELSIIVPTFREAQNIPILVREISAAMEHVLPEWELIIVDDNSRFAIFEFEDLFQPFF